MAARVVIPGLAEVGDYTGASLGCTDWLAIDAERLRRATLEAELMRRRGRAAAEGARR